MYTDALTDKQKLFCIEYLKDFNATNAYRRAYDNNAVRQCGADLLSRPHIQAHLKTLVGSVMERAEIDAAEVLSTIKKMALVDPEDIFNDLGYMKPLSLIPKEARLCISAIKNSRYGSSIQLEGRLKALDMLGKYLKLWQEGVNVSLAPAQDQPMKVVFDFTGETRGPGEDAPAAEPPADMWD